MVLKEQTIILLSDVLKDNRDLRSLYTIEIRNYTTYVKRTPL